VTYATDQLSVSDSAPIHLFIFTGTPTIYRHTGYPSDVVYAANAYTSIPISHGNADLALGAGDARELIVELPVTAQVVRDFGFGMPKRTLTLVVLRLQTLSGVATKIWEGNVADVAAIGRWAKLRVPNKAAAYEVNVPGAYRQAQCNLQLYSTLCGVVRADHLIATTASSVSANGKTIVVASVGGVFDQLFRHGEIVRDADGERRTIVSQIGTTLQINAEFRDLAVANAVTLYAGCDKRITTCHGKFANVENHRGMPYIRDRNPFRSGFLRRS